MDKYYTMRTLNRDKNTLANMPKLWAAHAEEHDVTDLLSANTGNIFGNETCPEDLEKCRIC